MALVLAPADEEQLEELYVQAWGLFRFLARHHGEGMKRYLAALAALAPGRVSPQVLYRVFRESFGSAGSLERSWVRYAACPEAGRLAGL